LSAIILNHFNHRLAQTFRLENIDVSSTSFSNKKYKFVISLKKQSKKYTLLSGQKEKSSLKFDQHKKIRQQTSSDKFNNHLPEIFSHSKHRYLKQTKHISPKKCISRIVHKNSKKVSLENILQHQLNQKGQVYDLTQRIYLTTIILKKHYLYLVKSYHCEKFVGLNTNISTTKYAFLISHKITVQKISRDYNQYYLVKKILRDDILPV
jgi:hypothetical protein